jgi:hypothetical protein
MGLREILKNRDGMSDEEIDKELDFCREMLLSGEMSPDEVCIDELGVEEDYLFDIIGY